MAVSGAGVALATAGGVILWAGLAGVSPLSIVKTVGSGKAPPAPDLNGLLGDLGSEFTGLFAQGLSGIGSAVTGGG